MDHVDVGDTFDRRDHRSRAGVEDNVIGDDGVVANTDSGPLSVAAVDLRVTMDQCQILHAGEAAFDSIAIFVDDAARAFDDRGKIDFDCGDADSEVSTAPGEVSNAGRGDRRLCRRASEVDA